MKLRSIVVLLTLSPAAACSEPVEPVDWTIPVPAGTPIIEHPAVSVDERKGKRIELVPDLVIGRRGEDPNYLFYFEDEVKALAVDDDGRVYVGDAGNRRVQVFDRQGRYRRSLGRPGPGPGELRSPPFLIAIAGERMIVGFWMQPYLEEWSLSGEFLLRREISDVFGFLRFGGITSGDLLAAYSFRYGEVRNWGQMVRVVRLPGTESTELEYLQQADPPRPADVLPGEFRIANPMVKLGMYRPAFAVTRGGDL